MDTLEMERIVKTSSVYWKSEVKDTMIYQIISK